MNYTEAVMLLRKVRAYRPAQFIDEFTGEAWAESLEDLRFEDASLAVKNIGKRTGDFIDPAAVRAEVKRIRKDRAFRAPEFVPSNPELSPAEQTAELREYWRAVGDGRTPTRIDHGALVPGPELQLAGRRIDEALESA